ncbi:MAG: glycosyltransferase family 39 protein [Armatimonadetes bacterium]|nr:glycosyltransferase family 39 protein [Armatimonadota bacterium]
MRPAYALAALLAIFAVLCVAFGLRTPYRQPGVLIHQNRAAAPDIGAPDERQHANYVRHLLDGKGFPVLVPGSPDLGETYQSHQPPLYYVLAAGWAKITSADPADAESGRRLRWLNTLIGMGTLLGIFFAARWGLESDAVGLAAVAFAGLMPMFIALHAAVSNDPLLFLACSWTVALAARGIRRGWDLKLALACGAVAGLGLLTKTTALALLPTLVAALATTKFWGEGRPCVRIWAVCLGLPIIIGLPWLARNQSLYGDPFAVSAFNEAFVGSPRPHHVAIDAAVLENDPRYNSAAVEAIGELGLGLDERPTPGQQKQVLDKIYEEVGFTFAVHNNYWVNWVGWWTARSYFGVFGYMDVFLFERQRSVRGEDPLAASNLAYRAMIAVAFLLFLGWLLSVRKLDDGPAKALHVTSAVLLAVVLVLFVRFNLQYFQGQGRYLYPAVAPIALGLGAGACHWMRGRRDLAWLAVAALLLLLDWAAYQAIAQGFPLRAA